MSTIILSREAFFLYSQDFRTGMNTFARGSLMAAQIDDRIRQQSQGKRDLRDALRAVLLQTQKEHRRVELANRLPVCSNT